MEFEIGASEQKSFDLFVEAMKSGGGDKLFKEFIVRELVSRAWEERNDKSTEVVKDVVADDDNGDRNRGEISQMHSLPMEKRDEATLPPKKRKAFQNPSIFVETCDTSNHQTNHKKRRTNISPSKSNEKKKKDKNSPPKPETPRPLPDRLRQRIEAMGGTDIKFIVQKKIFNADIVDRNNRISIPKTKIRDFSFLTESERLFILHRNEREEGDTTLVPGYDCPALRITLLLDFSMEESEQYFKTYYINIFSYVVTCNWNNLVKRHQDVLKIGETVQFWSFRKPANPENGAPKIVVEKNTRVMESNLCVVLVVL